MISNPVLKKFLPKNVIYNIGGVDKTHTMQSTSIYKYVLKQNQQHGRDIYFYINEGGTRVADIKKVRALYLDLDAGRDKQGKYKSTRVVDNFKKKAEKVIESFPYKPSVVTETRNGFQLIWFLKNSKLDLNSFNELQSKLWHWFDCNGVTPDPNCLRINQFFRVPESIWHKKWEGKPYFTCVNIKELASNSFALPSFTKYLTDYKLYALKLTVSPNGVLMLKDKERKFYKNTVSFHNPAVVKNTEACTYEKSKIVKTGKLKKKISIIMSLLQELEGELD